MPDNHTPQPLLDSDTMTSLRPRGTNLTQRKCN